MSYNRHTPKNVSLLCMMQVSILLVGCSSDDTDRLDAPLEVTVVPTVSEGTAPLEVTFNVNVTNGDVHVVQWNFGDGEIMDTVGLSSVPHTYTTPGQLTVSALVSTSRLGEPGQSFKIPITVFAGTGVDPGSQETDPDPEELPDVNLVVSSFAIDREVTPGGIETISAIIQNIGSAPLEGEGFLTVGYYLSTDDTITVDDIFIGDTSILLGTFFAEGDIAFGAQSLSPGQNYQYDHQLAVKGNVPGGTYFAGAIVDFIDEYEWYTFPRATETLEYIFPDRFFVPETNEEDNVRVLPAYQVTVTAPVCADDAFEPDDNSATATSITVGATQTHNFCFDNSDWLQFDAVQGNVYKITASSLGAEADTQLILYDADGNSILLFHDNIFTPIELPDPLDPVAAVLDCTLPGEETVDLECGTPLNPASEIVWEAQVTGTYFIKVRVTTCDEDKDPHCSVSPDGVGLSTGYNITLQ